MHTYGANIALFCGQTAYFGQQTVGFNRMAFLPALTNTQSAQIVKRETKSRREVDKKSGYRISLANIAATRSQDSCNIARSPSDKNDHRIVKQDLLPPLEDKKRNFTTKQSHNEEDRTRAKPLKLPKCPNPVIAKKSMFWMEPLGVWVPLKQRRKLYEKFSSSMDLLCKDPDCLVDPCPHIPRCDHSRSWSAVKLERQKFRELKQLRNEQLLEKAIDRYQNMQAFWLEQMNNRTEMLHTRPSHVRLQNFRKNTEAFLRPLDEAQRLERLVERQREWEEAWKLAHERREKACCQKKSPRYLLPRIVVTDYELVLACDEHVNMTNQSCDRYFEERYEVVCTPVQSFSASENNLRTQSFSKRIQGMKNKECRSGGCDPYTALERSEKGPESSSSRGHSASTEAIARDFEPSAKLDLTDKIRGDFYPGKSEDYSVGDNASISEGDSAKLGSSSETSVEHASLLMTSYSSSGTSLDKVVTMATLMDTSGLSTFEMRQAEGIKQADYTAHLMSRLAPVPLGVSSRKIPDQQLTASSTIDIYHTADQARMHNERQDNKGGAWLPRRHDVSPYLQIDLGTLTTVQQVATQGNPASAVKRERHKRWVTEFSLEFSQDGERWVEYEESGQVKIFTANFDLDTVVLNSLENTVETRYIRFRPKEWHNGIAMRVEVFGVNPFPDTDGAEDIVKSPDLDEEEEQGNIIEYLRDENELVKDEIVAEKQEVETVFHEKEGTSESIQFGLSVEGRAAPPTILHSPVPSLISPHEQQIQINDFMAIHTCTQNLSLRDNPDNDSEAESLRSQEILDDSKETSSVNSEIVLSNSTSEVTLLSDEKQEVPSHVTEDSTVAENDSSEPDQPSAAQCGEVTNLQVPPVTSSPPTSPPPESWVHALERARADGGIRRQMIREKMAEERRRKLAMLESKIRNPNSDHTSLTYEELDELGDFLEKYCIIGKSDVMIYKNIFEKFDEDNDGFLWPEEVLEALENINSRLLTDSHLSYVFRVLEQCDCQADIGIGFRLFSVIAALSQRVAALNDRMKMLISICDFKTIDYTLERVKMLFECYVNEVTMKISRTDLWIGLAAGGLRTAEATIDDYFSEKHSFDFLDFLTYLPLFQEIHGYVVENPLSLF